MNNMKQAYDISSFVVCGYNILFSLISLTILITIYIKENSIVRLIINLFLYFNLHGYPSLYFICSKSDSI